MKRAAAALCAALAVAACSDPAARMHADLARLQLVGLTYGETYRELATLGFDCGPYAQERWSLDARDLTCTRTVRRSFGCDLGQQVTVRQAETTWRTARISATSGPVCY